MFELNLINTSLLLAGACVLLVIVLLLYELRTNTSFAGVRYQVNPGPAPPVKDAFRNSEAPSLLHPLAPFFQQRMPWFCNLTPKAQHIFLKRVQQFMQARTFEGRSGLTVTDEMCLLISGEACRLTFGLTEYLLPDFNRILIYPDSFYSRSGKARHNGEVNISGIIALSWKHFLQGISNTTDAVNLGLHEFTHALRFQGFRGGAKDPFFAMYYPKFRAVALRHMDALRRKKVLRSYGFTNDEEFLAVCAEHFFEAPQSLQTHAPEIYEQLCILLNQDPLRPQFKSQVFAQPVISDPSEQAFLKSMTLQFQAFLLRHLLLLGAPVLLVAGFIFSGYLCLASFLCIYLYIVLYMSASGCNADMQLFANHAEIRTVTFLNRMRLRIPYSSITKAVYTEGLEMIYATDDYSENDRFTTLELEVMEPGGTKTYKTRLTKLPHKTAAHLIRHLRRNNIWVRTTLRGWELADYPETKTPSAI
jgi:Mlc titration factor MtfA (ptsG expression regulator)